MELRGRPKGGKNRHHSKDFKLEVVKRVLAGEGSKTLAPFEKRHQFCA